MAENEVIGDDSSNIINQKFITRIFHESNNEVIGCEVVLYDDVGEIDSIEITETKTINELNQKWNNIKDYYVLRGDVTLPDDLQEQVDNGVLTLHEILKNKDGNIEINATKLYEGGTNYTPSSFASANHNHEGLYCKNYHASSNPDTYGIGDANYYGHVRIKDDLNDSTLQSGIALSSHQGYVLNQEITVLKGTNKWSGVTTIGNYIKYRVNPDLRLVVCNYNRSDYTGLKNSTGSKELHKAGTIPSTYKPSSRVLTPLYRGDVVLYYNTDGSIKLYNLTKIKNINIHAQVMWHY